MFTEKRAGRTRFHGGRQESRSQKRLKGKGAAKSSILRGKQAMNIQIFGKSKCFDTKKAQRYFKERRVKVQSIDVEKYGMSQGEFRSVKSGAGGLEALIDQNSKLYEQLHIAYLERKEDIEQLLLENPGLFKTPIVRNGKQATVGYQPDIWKTWE
jgi:arsenate reductase